MSRNVTRAQFLAADRKVRGNGYKVQPRTEAEAIAFCVRYPDCVGKNHPAFSTGLVSRDATADEVITGRWRATRRRMEGEGVWQADAYFANFLPSYCSWRPTKPFSGAAFERRPLP